MNWYEEKQEARKARMEARAERLASQGAAKIESGMERLRAIPFGQPILVGHHSERRDRNYRAKAGASIDAGFELRKRADELASRAASVGSGGISSDDPDAVTKLREKLSGMEAEQTQMKATNAAWRKSGNKAGRQPDGSWIDPPHPSFELTNLSANIRRVKERIAHLEKCASRETTKTERADGVRVVENAEINRLQVFFPGKPSEEVRSRLKHSGFRWSPSEGAWQRQLGQNAKWALEGVLNTMQNFDGGSE